MVHQMSPVTLTEKCSELISFSKIKYTIYNQVKTYHYNLSTSFPCWYQQEAGFIGPWALPATLIRRLMKQPMAQHGGTGCRSRNASGSKSLSLCVIVSSVRRPNIWQNSVVRWVHLWSAVSTLCLTWWSHCSEIPTSKIWLKAFAVSGPYVWNSLPTEIRQSCNNLLQFKSKLKTFLFQQSLSPFVDTYLMRDLTNALYYY